VFEKSNEYEILYFCVDEYGQTKTIKLIDTLTQKQYDEMVDKEYKVLYSVYHKLIYSDNDFSVLYYDKKIDGKDEFTNQDCALILVFNNKIILKEKIINVFSEVLNKNKIDICLVMHLLNLFDINIDNFPEYLL